MEFYVNHPILFLLAGLLVAVVLGQSVYFLVKALKRAAKPGDIILFKASHGMHLELALEAFLKEEK